MKCPGCGAPVIKVGMLKCEYCSVILPAPPPVNPTGFRPPPQNFSSPHFHQSQQRNAGQRPPQGPPINNNWKQRQNRNQWGMGNNPPPPPPSRRMNSGGIIGLVVTLVFVFIVFPAIFVPTCAVMSCGIGCLNSCDNHPSVDVQSVSIWPNHRVGGTVFIGEDGSRTFSASVESSSWHWEVSWQSENTAIATVTQNGEVTAVGVGSTRIFATSLDNTAIYDFVWITVLPNEITSFHISRNRGRVTISGLAHDRDPFCHVGGDSYTLQFIMDTWDNLDSKILTTTQTAIIVPMEVRPGRNSTHFSASFQIPSDIRLETVGFSRVSSVEVF